ncbi:MAG TPA: dethiobiotin synthase [Burkholderiales bacterium]|nr:dethiobiotin synthase [Burkholderiales bacterium]
MPRGFFITGTDTGVGKTLVACALLHALARRGERAAGMKPVASGAVRTVNGLRNEDVEALLAASNVKVARELVNPYCFETPIAPHLAAQRAGVEISLDNIAAAFAALAERADRVVVEGIGGFRVPLNAAEDGADLAARLDLPVILVVGVRLGCLNHALLTAHAIVERGLVFAGWIANRIDPQMEAADLNVDALEQRLAAPLLGDIGHMSTPDAAIIAARLDLSLLR